MRESFWYNLRCKTGIITRSGLIRRFGLKLLSNWCWLIIFKTVWVSQGLFLCGSRCRCIRFYSLVLIRRFWNTHGRHIFRKVDCFVEWRNITRCLLPPKGTLDISANYFCSWRNVVLFFSWLVESFIFRRSWKLRLKARWIEIVKSKNIKSSDHSKNGRCNRIPRIQQKPLWWLEGSSSEDDGENSDIPWFYCRWWCQHWIFCLKRVFFLKRFCLNRGQRRMTL